MFSVGHGRKTDATDAHSIAVVAVRSPGLTPVTVDDEMVALRLGRAKSGGRRRTDLT